MSGRVRVTLADGRQVVGYRKTLIQRRRRTPSERATVLHNRVSRRFKTDWPVRVGFQLPKDIAAFVSDGPHGGRIFVLRGYVQVAHASTIEAMREAERFLREVAHGKPSFDTIAVITSRDEPRPFFRELVMVNEPSLVECSASLKPRVYGAEA